MLQKSLSAIGETIKKKLAIEETELGKPKSFQSLWGSECDLAIPQSLGPEDQDESEVHSLVTIGQDPKASVFNVET